MGIEPTLSGLEDQRTSVSASQTWGRCEVTGVSIFLTPHTRNLSPAIWLWEWGSNPRSLD